jgi:hypothetical protein
LAAAVCDFWQQFFFISVFPKLAAQHDFRSNYITLDIIAKPISTYLSQRLAI